MKTLRTTASIVSLAGAVLAQSPLYGQCGGQGWTGDKTCVAGAHCQYYNDWYSQCIPGGASSSGGSGPPRSTTSSSRPSTTSHSPPPASGTGEITTISGTLFKIDGVTSYFAGTNCYWCGFLTQDGDLDITLDAVQDAGLKILRVWGFNDITTQPTQNQQYFQYLSASGSTINTGAYGLQLLDKVVSGAESRGIKLIINFVNNWDDYGGISAYTRAFGGTNQGWFTNTQAQAQYQKYIKAVISRYIDSSAILAWELANEPRCNGCDTDVIYNWATTTSQYIKSLDPKHLVTMGDEGFGLPGDGSYPYTYAEGVDWEKNLQIDTLDFATFHLYPDSWGESLNWGSPWVTAHAKLCDQVGKPCFFEEYGTTSNKCASEQPWQQTSLSYAGNGKGMAGDAFWQFGTQLTYSQSPNDGNTIYVGTDDFTCLVTDHVAAI